MGAVFRGRAARRALGTAVVRPASVRGQEPLPASDAAGHCARGLVALACKRPLNARLATGVVLSFFLTLCARTRPHAPCRGACWALPPPPSPRAGQPAHRRRVQHHHSGKAVAWPVKRTVRYSARRGAAGRPAEGGGARAQTHAARGAAPPHVLARQLARGRASGRLARINLTKVPPAAQDEWGASWPYG